jgi:ribosome recycling factor
VTVGEEIFEDVTRRMGTSIEHLRRELSTIRTGRASLALLEPIQVDYYGTPTPLNQLATLAVPESRLKLNGPSLRATWA